MNKLFQNLVGQKFNRLVVIKYIGMKYPNKRTKGHQWLCRCDCGKEKIILGGALKSNKILSCGCYRNEQIKKSKFIDITGKRFGRLIVINISECKNGQYYWLCQCDCGNKKLIAGNSLRFGKSKSCGCRRGRFTHGLSKDRKVYRKFLRSNPLIRLQHNVSVSVRDAIKERNGKKSGKTFQHLPYSVEELKEHLENLWEDWMNWENYGGKNNLKYKTWHIDHVIPHSKFHYTTLTDSLFQQCWSLSNLRPLEKIENIRKNNR